MLYRTEDPYLKFNRTQWEQLRRGMPLTLTEEDLEQLHGKIEAVSLSEVIEIYLPLSRLLNLYASATQNLHQAAQAFLGHDGERVPYIIGVTGSVAVGKSLTSRLLQALLSHWPNHPNVALVTTDGFLYSNAELERRGLSLRKGFPESFDHEALLQFVIDLKSGRPNLKVPQYSHHTYDVVPDLAVTINRPDIVIIEGVNILQPEILREDGVQQTLVADFIDFNIYVEAPTAYIKEWFIQRFLLFRELAQGDERLFFNRFADLTQSEARQFAVEVWESINELNLKENILPYRERADLILSKERDHSVSEVWLRKI